jgi:hypothetical protein
VDPQEPFASLSAAEEQLQLALAQIRNLAAELPAGRQEFALHLIAEAQACLTELASVSDSLDEFLKAEGEGRG